MSNDDEAVDRARSARRQFGQNLAAHRDVHGVGVGRRRRGGELTDEIAVVVHVLHKLPAESIEPDRLIPSELRWVAEDGTERIVPIDVQQRPKPVPEADEVHVQGRVRPVPGGVSVDFSGTLGAWVWDPQTSQPVALSNRHVFGSVAGVQIVQPSGDDGGAKPQDVIAVVLRTATLDAAVAAPLEPGFASNEILAAGRKQFEIADAAVGMRVQKVGRTTGLTTGVVDLIDYDSGHFGSSKDLWIDGGDADFSSMGDSGAVYVVPGANAIVGLHWGGADSDGVGHPIRAVFDELGVTTLPMSRTPST